VSEGAGKSMDNTAGTLVVLTSEEEHAARVPWARRWVERYAGAAALGSTPETARRDVAATFAADPADARLRQAAEDWGLVLAVLGVDGSPPAAPGTCPKCGRPRTLHDSAYGMPLCQQCTRKLQQPAAAP
jgi:hypothetical protein